MPQLYSRMDAINWMTPSIADILDQGAAPPGGNGSIREQMLLLQRKLSELDTPARVINVRPTPSYTMFITKPDIVNWQGNRRIVTVNEIKRSIGQIAEEKKEWKLGFLPRLNEVADSVGILLRTEEHSALSLRRLLVRTSFRNHPSSMAFALGNTLEQHLIIYDLAEIGSILIAGKQNARLSFVYSLLLTLVALNTPGELRLTIAGQSSNSVKDFIKLPHGLGKVMIDPRDGVRMLEGLVTELKKRQHWFARENVNSLEDYNKILQEQGRTPLPRLIMLIESLSDPGWQQTKETWQVFLNEILADQGRCGIHTILTTLELNTEHIAEPLLDHLPVQVVTRSAAGDYASQLEDFHGSLVRFIDAFCITDDQITPVESCAISAEEISKTIAYWHAAVRQRQEETRATKVSGTTGVTGLLNRPTTETKTQPPTAEEIDEVEEETAPQTPVSPEPEPDDSPSVLDTQQAALDEIGELDVILKQAHALAAYLGWIAPGALQDVLGLSPEESQRVIGLLRKMRVIENGNSPTPRFIRLVDPPTHENE